MDKIIEKYMPNIIKIRQELHQIPELAFEEYQTSEFIKNELTKLGIPFQDNIAKTGIVAFIKGNGTKTIALRSDMDALPIKEESRYKYPSKHDGIMHACGHDGHMAGLLGTAMVLNEIKDKLKGNVKLIFQPAEEGRGGSLPMIQTGILEDVDAIFGLHLWPQFNSGKIVIKNNEIMASSTAFYIKITGRGGHGSAPQLTCDPIVIGCQTICALQNIISREISTFKPAVISCCSIKAGETFNVIPNELEIKGTIRSYDEELTSFIAKRIKEITDGITKSFGAKFQFEIDKTYPPVINNSQLFEFSKNVFIDTFGKDNVVELQEPVMAAEDFSYYGKYIPANFFFVGTGGTQETEESYLHHPKLYWEDDELKTSVKAFTNLVLAYFNK